MKFDSKLLLEQLIRTHILEQSIVTDTNVKRGKVGSATSYGSIDSPSNVSSADRSFFDKVNSIKRTNPKSKRPYIKLYSNVTKGGTASENDRLQSVAGVARREASTLIDRFGGPGALSEYSAIISKPQDAKKQADASSTVSYDPSAKLYYTVVFIMTSDINTTISPEWGVTGTMKFFGEDQISSLKPVVTPKDDEVIDDTSKNKQDIDTKDDSELTPEQLSNQFITKKTQLNNLGNSGDAAKNLQRAMYTFGMKESSGEFKNLPEFKSFINASWNTSRVPGDWDGEIGTRSRALIDILKPGFTVTSDADLYTKLQAAINEIQPNLSESKLYKLTEQAGFNIDKAKKASSNKQRVKQKNDSSSGTSVKYRGKFASKAVEDLYKIIVQAQNSAKENLGKDLIVRSAPRLSAVAEENSFGQIKQTISTEHIYAEDESRLVITDFECFVDANESLTVLASISVNKSPVPAAFNIASNKIKMNSDSGVLNLNSKIIKPIGVVGVTGNVTLIDYFMNPFKYLSLDVNNESQLTDHINQMNDWTRNIAVSIKDFILDSKNFIGYIGTKRTWSTLGIFSDDDENGAWTDVVMAQWNDGVPSWFPEDPRFAHSWNGQVNQLQTLVNQLDMVSLNNSELTAIVQKFQTDVDSYRNMFKTGSVFYNKFHGNTADDTYWYGYHVANPDGTGVSYQKISVDTDFG